MRFEKRDNCYCLTTNNREEYESSDWLIFYWSWCFNITFEICGYFDNRPRIVLGLIFFRLTLILPFRNKWTDECDCPRWGVAIHNNILWIYKGGKGNLNGGTEWWTWDIPFLTKEWYRTSILLKDDTWEHETKRNRKNFYKPEWKNKQKSWEYKYIDKYDGEEIPTTIYVDEREWRPKWLTWTNLFSKTVRTIDVHFSKECGRRKGSWKGGTIGCSYTLLPNENVLECIKRMEKERDF